MKFNNYIVGLKPVYLIQDNQHININESIYKFLGDDIIYNYFEKFKYVLFYFILFYTLPHG